MSNSTLKILRTLIIALFAVLLSQPVFGGAITFNIGDFVWHDLNVNGLQDAGESGFGGVTLLLKDNVGNVLQTTTSDSNGFYNFTVDGFQAYSLTAFAPVGYNASPANVGGNNQIDSNSNPFGLFTPTGNDPTIDFGFTTPSGVGVPDAGSTVSLLGLASLGLVALRRKLRC